MPPFLHRNPRTAWRTLEGRAAIVLVDEGRMVTLSPSGTKIWEALSEPRTVDELAQVLVRAYGIDPATAKADCEKFCADLLEKGLLVPAAE